MQKTIEIPAWEYGIWECVGKLVYGIVYDEVTHYPCFQIKAYKATRKKGQNIKWRYEECAVNEFVEAHAPHLAHLVELLPFDGWLETGLPVHYHANALYFYKRSKRWFSIGGKSFQSEERLHRDLFCYVTLFGLLGDENEKLPVMDSAKELYKLSQWLKEREPKLKAAFNATMKKFEVI